MIPTFDYLRTLDEVEAPTMEAVQRVLRSGQLILGPETRAFEAEFATYVGAEHAIGVSSGTSAIHLALMALGVGVGDEVLTVANTCAPTVAAIRLTGATPVFVDVRDKDLMMDATQLPGLVSDRTKAIVAVHLYGRAVDLDAVAAAAPGVPIVEDCAQAHGTTLGGRHVGTIGVAGCFSFYPTKNVGAFGDAGAVVTNDAALGASMRSRRMYGYAGDRVSEVEGMNVRINEIQAAVLRIKLACFDDWLHRRRAVAARYDAAIQAPGVRLPPVQTGVLPSHHQYVIRCADRASVCRALDAAEIGYGVHYPVPVHRMPAYAQFSRPLPVTEAACDQILSLPVHEGLRPDEVDTVVSTLNGMS